MSPDTRTTHPTTLTATFEDDRYTWTRTVRTRRGGVVAEVALLAAMVAVALLAAVELVGVTPSVVVWTAGFVAFIPLHAVVNLGVRGLFDRREATLDELQRTVRDRSAAATERLRVGLSLVAVLAAAATAVNAGVPTQGYAVGFALWFVSWLVPTWHLAWTLPEED